MLLALTSAAYADRASVKEVQEAFVGRTTGNEWRRRDGSRLETNASDVIRAFGCT
jgi:hypothetical protein